MFSIRPQRPFINFGKEKYQVNVTYNTYFQNLSENRYILDLRNIKKMINLILSNFMPLISIEKH